MHIALLRKKCKRLKCRSAVFSQRHANFHLQNEFEPTVGGQQCRHVKACRKYCFKLSIGGWVFIDFDGMMHNYADATMHSAIQFLTDPLRRLTLKELYAGRTAANHGRHNADRHETRWLRQHLRGDDRAHSKHASVFTDANHGSS